MPRSLFKLNQLVAEDAASIDDREIPMKWPLDADSGEQIAYRSIVDIVQHLLRLQREICLCVRLFALIRYIYSKSR